MVYGDANLSAFKQYLRLADARNSNNKCLLVDIDNPDHAAIDGCVADLLSSMAVSGLDVAGSCVRTSDGVDYANSRDEMTNAFRQIRDAAHRFAIVHDVDSRGVSMAFTLENMTRLRDQLAFISVKHMPGHIDPLGVVAETLGIMTHNFPEYNESCITYLKRASRGDIMYDYLPLPAEDYNSWLDIRTSAKNMLQCLRSTVS